MKPIQEMNQAELAAFVQEHLRAREIEVVLSGGAVVGIYSDGKYVSKDIDLVNAQFVERHRIESAMQEIGFIPVGRHFEHPNSDQIIEFPTGPLSLGSDKVTQINEIMMETGILRTLSPTDCVKDRLSHYFHWGDQQCLVQAKLVAANHLIDFNDVRKWSMREGKGDAYEEIKEDIE
jgi:hypothetical protein